MYISDTSPASERAVLMSSYPAILQLSALAGFGAAYLSNSLIPASSDLQWRLPVAIRLGPGSILLVGTILAPETPRFLAEAGRLGEAEAEAVLAWWRGVRGEEWRVGGEMQEIADVVRAGRGLERAVGERLRGRASESGWWLRRTCLG
ncbi:hypothetical protein PZA11_007233 [Diplocarpon coronariae]